MLSSLASNLPIYLMRLPVILLAITIHESAHAWVANKLGDGTAKAMGRITLNPLAHIDPIGAVCMLLFGFGWASPVPINSSNFKNKKLGIILTSLAGPVSNLILGFAGAILYSIYSLFLYDKTALLNGTVAYVIALFLYVFMSLNISLAVFNLIPIPPLDGSNVLFTFLPIKWYYAIQKYQRYITLAFLVLLWLDVLSIPLSYAVVGIQSAYFAVIDWFIGLFYAI